MLSVAKHPSAPGGGETLRCAQGDIVTVFNSESALNLYLEQQLLNRHDEYIAGAGSLKLLHDIPEDILPHGGM